MKTKFKYLALMVSVALLAGFSSCSNDDVPAENAGGTKNLFLKISSAPATKAEGAVQAAAPVVFNDGVLYFTSSGNIEAQYTISSAPTSGSNINITTLTGAGETIENLPNSVDHVYVVGNVPTTVSLPASGSILAVQQAVLVVATQGTISNVSLYGDDATSLLTAGGGASGNDLYEANITLAPVVARIELADITSSGDIVSYKVAGIFVDNYYSQGEVDGLVAATNLVNNGMDPTKFSDGTSEYPTALKPSIYDWYPTALTPSSNVVAPATAGQVWGYNVFAAAAGSSVPRIIIRLEDVMLSSGAPTSGSTQFITISGYKDASSVALTSFEAGKVYTLSAGTLIFDENDIDPVPNSNLIDVKVTVTLTNWTVVPVTPVI
ncbi:hypothetical protein [Dysgonomonas reticulitermitis]